MNFLSPLFHCLGLAVKGEHVIGAPITGLFHGSCPAAIFRLIVAAVIYSIKGCSGRTLAHIDKKVLKGEPSFTDNDSALAVQMGVRATGVLAPFYHLPPTPIRRSVGQSVSALAALICSQTSATSSRPRNEGAAGDTLEVAAIASTDPKCCGFFTASITYDGKAAESATLMVNEVPRWFGLKFNVIIRASHVVFSSVENLLARLGRVLVAPFRAVSILPQGA